MSDHMPSAEEFKRNVIAEFRRSAPVTADSIKIRSVPLEFIQAMSLHVEPDVTEQNCTDDEEDLAEM